MTHTFVKIIFLLCLLLSNTVRADSTMNSVFNDIMTYDAKHKQAIAQEKAKHRREQQREKAKRNAQRDALYALDLESRKLDLEMKRKYVARGDEFADEALKREKALTDVIQSVADSNRMKAGMQKIEAEKK